MKTQGEVAWHTAFPCGLQEVLDFSPPKRQQVTFCGLNRWSVVLCYGSPRTPTWSSVHSTLDHWLLADPAPWHHPQAPGVLGEGGRHLRKTRSLHTGPEEPRSPSTGVAAARPARPAVTVT